MGDYPCCGELLCLSCPEKTPAFLPENCPNCGKKVWHYLSRLDPCSYTEEEFNAEFEVNEEEKSIKKREQGK